MTSCSYNSLNLIETGAVPKRSRVLERGWAALEDHARNHGCSPLNVFSDRSPIVATFED